jgi:hypothetical protein
MGGVFSFLRQQAPLFEQMYRSDHWSGVIVSTHIPVFSAGIPSRESEMTNFGRIPVAGIRMDRRFCWDMFRKYMGT